MKSIQEEIEQAAKESGNEGFVYGGSNVKTSQTVEEKAIQYYLKPDLLPKEVTVVTLKEIVVAAFIAGNAEGFESRQGECDQLKSDNAKLKQMVEELQELNSILNRKQ